MSSDSAMEVHRKALFKKAIELSTLCGSASDVCMLIFSDSGMAYSFLVPSRDYVSDISSKSRKPLSIYGRLFEAHRQGMVDRLNKRLDETLEKEEREIEREKRLNESQVASLTSKEHAKWLKDIQMRTTNRIIEEMQQKNAPPPPAYYLATEDDGGGVDECLLDTASSSFMFDPQKQGGGNGEAHQ